MELEQRQAYQKTYRGLAKKNPLRGKYPKFQTHTDLKGLNPVGTVWTLRNHSTIAGLRVAVYEGRYYDERVGTLCLESLQKRPDIFQQIT